MVYLKANLVKNVYFLLFMWLLHLNVNIQCLVFAQKFNRIIFSAEKNTYFKINDKNNKHVDFKGDTAVSTLTVASSSDSLQLIREFYYDNVVRHTNANRREIVHLNHSRWISKRELAPNEDEDQDEEPALSTTRTMTSTTTKTTRKYLEMMMLNNDNSAQNEEKANSDAAATTQRGECKLASTDMTLNLNKCGRVTVTTNVCAGLCKSSEHLIVNTHFKKRTCWACKPYKFATKTYKVKCVDKTYSYLTVKLVTACSCFKHSEALVKLAIADDS
jgi:hypothetical protein